MSATLSRHVIGLKGAAISTKVFVGNLSFSTTKEELTTLLNEAGRVVNVHLPTDRETGRPRGFAFVEFSQPGEAADAITRFHNREVGGRRLNVNAADDRPRRGPSPGGFRPSGPSSYSASAPAPSFGDSQEPGRDDFGYGGAAAGRPFKNKGSRRGLRARKRSLNF
jgi:RNA recognition motif-containing protein